MARRTAPGLQDRNGKAVGRAKRQADRDDDTDAGVRPPGARETGHEETRRVRSGYARSHQLLRVLGRTGKARSLSHRNLRSHLSRRVPGLRVSAEEEIG